MPDTGAPWNIPYVEATDLVSDWPADSLALANAIVAALEDIPVTQKKIEAFTGSGTWTVPAGVTYAIAHMLGGGGGTGTGSSGGAGAASQVVFSGGTVESLGGAKISTSSVLDTTSVTAAGSANSGRGATVFGFRDRPESSHGGGSANAADGQWIVAGGVVAPAASITVTVGAGGAAGTSGAAGGSGYVYIEFYEEV
jgi:hypothetical protein